MVHKHKSFPVGKNGQRELKQRYSSIQGNNTNSQIDIPKPDGTAVLGTKAVHVSFLSILGSNAREQVSQKGGRKTRIDPLSLKKIADTLLKEIENKSMHNQNETSDEESSDMSNTYC